jgi:hypothetical protein
MIKHGWVFNWNDAYVFLSGDNRYCKSVPSTSYCGFKYPGDGMISYTFSYDGTATLEYGHSSDRGSVHVKKNDVEIDSRDTRGSSTTTFDFFAGDTLTITELGSVMNIHTLSLQRSNETSSNDIALNRPPRIDDEGMTQIECSKALLAIHSERRSGVETVCFSEDTVYPFPGIFITI